MAFNLAQEQDAIRKAIKRVSTEDARQRFAAELDSLSSQYATATPADQAAMENRIQQLRRDAEIAAGVNLWSWASIGLVGLVIILYFGGIFLYMQGLGPERYASIEATRPILVFTLIVAMLGFGGVLIVRALFSNCTDEELQKKFRHAREIFLVFAGIFGTIIGFYFGAADEESGTPPSLSEPAFQAPNVTAEIEGGRPPFISLLTRDGQPVGQAQGDQRALSFNVGATCPANASITVVDGEGRRDDADLACPAAPGNGQPGTVIDTPDTVEPAAGTATGNISATPPAP